MVRISLLMKSMVVGVALLALGACSSIYRNHGYVPNDSDLDLVIVGVDTKDSIAETIGRPTSVGVLDDGGWYYVQSRWLHRGMMAPKEVDREMVAISFDQNAVVENIERFGIEDGRVIVLSRRVTDTNIKGISFIRQLLGNIGNFTADQFLGE